MKSGLYVYGIYWKNSKNDVVYADQSLSPNPNLYTVGQVLGKAKVVAISVGSAIQEAGFDYVVFIEPVKDIK